MLNLATASAAALLVAASPNMFSDGRPPERFQNDATFVIELKDQPGINKACHPMFGTPPAGMKTDACSYRGRVIMPNPCAYDSTESYARMLCHELGHVNGWSPGHD